jgi:hypothetical protein
MGWSFFCCGKVNKLFAVRGGICGNRSKARHKKIQIKRKIE